MKKSIVLSAGLILMPAFAHAYIGPGVGAGAVAALFGVIGSIFLALFAVLYYPIKRAMKKRKAAAITSDTDTPNEQ